MRYFIYCRKSSEDKGRQIISIPSQRSEIERRFKDDATLVVADDFKEEQSAKDVGRPIFNNMLDLVERGEAEGIIAWSPDRLARNSIDGGRIIHLLDRGVLKNIKFVTYGFENNPQGKFMLAILFADSKLYVDSLSVNVKRGHGAKLERGWYPGPSKLGYRHDEHSKRLVPDGEHFRTIQKLLQSALTGAYSTRQLMRMLNDDWGYRLPKNRKYGGGPMSRATFYRILADPFYAGSFLWNGQLYQGRHQPMISMEEFNRLRAIFRRPGVEKPKRHSFPFVGLIRCGACGLMVTAEIQINRYGSTYNYYHCTRRNREARCTQPSITADQLSNEFVQRLDEITIDDAIHSALVAEAALGSNSPEKNTSTIRAAIEKEIAEYRRQLSTLTDLRVRGLIDDAEYLERRTELQIAETRATERLSETERTRDWFEPAELYFSFLNRAISWFKQGTDEIKRLILVTVGSNLRLVDKKVIWDTKIPFMWNVEEASNPHLRGAVDDVRTRFESRDPEFMAVIDNIRKITAMVEAGTYEEFDRR